MVVYRSKSLSNRYYWHIQASRFRRGVHMAAVALLALCMGASATASTLQEPGFTETLIDSIAEATNGFGGMVTDSSGNLYFAANYANEVYVVPPDGSASQFGSVAGTNAQGVAIIGTTLYSSFDDGDAVYEQDLQQPNPAGVLVATVPAGAFGMAVIPAGFGAYGGQLAVGTQTGISILNPANGDVVVLWTASSEIPDVAFTLDGKLLGVRPDGGEIVEVTSAGVASVFASGLGSPDGIAIQPSTGEIYVTNPDSQQIIKLQPDGSAPSTFASDAAVDGGWYPSPIAFSVNGADMFYATRENGSTIYRISGFDGTGANAGPLLPVPLLSNTGLLALMLILALAGFGAMRRRSKI